MNNVPRTAIKTRARLAEFPPLRLYFAPLKTTAGNVATPIITRQNGPCVTSEVKGVDMTRPLSPDLTPRSMPEELRLPTTFADVSTSLSPRHG